MTARSGACSSCPCGELIGYDAAHGTDLVLTPSEYLDRGGSYKSTAQALMVHRSTLKYRLRRIREVSGHDLCAKPDRALVLTVLS